MFDTSIWLFNNFTPLISVNYENAPGLGLRMFGVFLTISLMPCRQCHGELFHNQSATFGNGIYTLLNNSTKVTK